MKRYKSILVGAILVLVAMLSSTTLYASTNDTGTNSFDETDFIDVSYNSSLSSNFKYDDSMMLTDANNLSGDLAKVSVGLAVAAYEQGEIVKCFDKMEYEVSTYNYEKTSTYENNDFVAYSIGYKSITYNGVTYNAYIVPIRGTKANCEWFSNFNLGNRSDGYHEGFKLAADEVLASIKNKVKTGNNIFLITGHSRGAGVANIVAGELSTYYNYATQNRIHAYTFACPAVRLNISGTLSNIRNYNNMGDVIASIPLQEWGYKRYGIDMPLSANQEIYNNFKTRFKSVYGEEYGGTLSTDSFISAMKNFVSTREDYYSDENQFLLDVVAWFLGERTTANAVKVVNNHNVSYVAKKSLISILTNATTGTIQYGIDKEYRNSIDFLAEIDEALTETGGMEDVDFYYWTRNNTSLISRISDKLNIYVNTRSDLIMARNTLESSLDDISYMATSIESIVNLFYSTDGEPIDAVFHAHTRETYVLWINTMYYGYMGWYGNVDVQNIRIGSEITTVGDYCFYACRGLKETIIDNKVRRLGTNSFVNCSGLETLTMPISTEFQTEPTEYNDQYCFTGLSSLKTLHYTLGTGETFNCEYGPAHYSFFTKYNCGGETLTTVTFEEGIKEICPRMFYECKNLTTVKLPSTLETIGDYAFYYCASWSEEVVLPETLTSIGDYAFSNTAITGDLVIPERITELKSGVFSGCSKLESIKSTGSITAIGDHCFFGCVGLKEAIIGDNVETLGCNAFVNCSGLEMLTMPISAKFQTEPTNYRYCFSGLSSLKTLNYTVGTGETFNCEYGPAYCSSTTQYNCGGETLTTVTFEEGIKEICARMFYYCQNLTTVKLPSTLETIGDSAFYGVSDEFVMYGYIGNTAQNYAKEKNIDFAGFGDADGDGLLNVRDATKLQKYLVGIGLIDDVRTYATDVDGDGELSICDITYIQKYLVDCIEVFPI